MALSKKKATRVAAVMVSALGQQKALDLMLDMNDAAYGKNPDKKLKSFRRIIKALQPKASKKSQKAA